KVDGAVGAFSQGFLYGLAHALRAEADHYYLAALAFLLPQSLFQRVRVCLAHLVAEVAFVDPLLVGADPEDRVLLWDLFQAHYYVHESPDRLRTRGLFILFHQQSGIGSTESERVRKRIANPRAPGGIRHIVQVAIRVRFFVVDGGRHYLIKQ